MFTAHTEQFLQTPRQALGWVRDHKIHIKVSVSALHVAFAPKAATVQRILDRRDDTDTASSSNALPTTVRRDSLSPVHLPQELLPRHIAVSVSCYHTDRISYRDILTRLYLQIIMDGNARWAQTRGLHTNLGHEAGTEALQRTVQCCLKWNVPALTVLSILSTSARF